MKLSLQSTQVLDVSLLLSFFFRQSRRMKRFWGVILPFTLASPAGILVGFILSDVARGSGAAAISALASGTFLYVAFMEVIPREISDPRHSGAKMLALLLGYGLMSLLAIWA
jgi:solute carrier family 39 (zinc transporter), member 1/2/3